MNELILHCDIVLPLKDVFRTTSQLIGVAIVAFTSIITYFVFYVVFVADNHIFCLFNQTGINKC